jgi:hypothetical protein
MRQPLTRAKARGQRTEGRGQRVRGPRFCPLFSVLCSLGFFFLPLGAAHAQRQGAQLGDLTVLVGPQPKDECNHGYTEYVITVTNQSAERPHEVTLSIPRHSYHPPQDFLQEVTRTVRVGPGSTVRVGLLQPYRPVLQGTGLAVSIDGRQQERFVDFVPRPSRVSPFSRPMGGGSASVGVLPSQPLVLLSRGTPEDFRTAVERALEAASPPPTMGVPPPAGKPADPIRPGPVVKGPSPPAKTPATGWKTLPPPTGRGTPAPPVFGGAFVSGGTPPPARVRFTRPEVHVDAWSATWLAYSCYDGVVLTGEELARAPANVQAALWQFAETGGALLVLGEARVPEGWRPRGETATGYKAYWAGFGEGAVALDANYSRWPAARWNELRSAWTRAGGPWNRVRTVAEAHDDFPVVGDIGVPVRGLFVLMLVFVVLIGPVNLTVLARKKRRLWLLWTVPLTSLVTCLVVFGYMLAAEGWQGHRRTAALTLLDGHSHRATTLAWTGFYTPLTPGDGLHFDNDTEVAPQDAAEYRYGHRGGTAHTLEWGADQHLARGWVQPRVPAHFMLRKSEPRRERVTVARGADGALSVVNGLGAEVRHFWYADERGQVHTADGIPPGARATLTPAGKKAQGDPGTALRRAYAGDWLATLGDLPKHPEAYLAPGSYLAELGSAPFVEEGLRGARADGCWSVVLGTLKGTGDEN